MRASYQHLLGVPGPPPYIVPLWLIFRLERGLIDGVTTLELDNGITKVRNFD